MKSAMIYVQRSHVVCAAHRLTYHQKKCENLHGHNYTITYYLTGLFDDNTGMIIDFGEIKQKLCNTTDYMLDHKTILHEKDPLIQVLLPILGENGIVKMSAHPTAENMAMMILASLQCILPNGVNLYKVTVEETPGCIATAEKGE